MSISPINFNGMIQNTNEISHTKANEDQKPLLQQELLTSAVEKKQEQQSKQVNDPNNTNKTGDKYDREGNGKGYEGNKNRKSPKNKKGQELQGDGEVTEKPKPSFDMRV
ncbi:MAG: hypothetical protein K6F66_06320 [Pseudobutyrivibrio sp.]|nr:hypothetical protein [Pseudobutyrivibrio sp.]